MKKQQFLFLALLIGLVVFSFQTAVATRSISANGCSCDRALIYVPLSADHAGFIFANLFSEVEITEDDNVQNGQGNPTTFLAAQCDYDILDHIPSVTSRLSSSTIEISRASRQLLFILHHSWKNDLA